MNWNARLKGALHGEMDGADVTARITGAYPLAELRRQVADKRLEAELAHPGEEWLLTDDLATLETPLWQADALVTLAQSLIEAEQEAHPDRPSMLSPISHEEAMALLNPIETILAQVSTGLFDPARRPTLAGVYLVTPLGLGGSYALPPAYLKGVQRGAERLEGMARTALDDLEALVHRSGGPDWISNGIRGARADLAGAQTTLQSLGLRVSAPGGAQGGEAATSQLARELWQIVNAYLRAGQLALAPRLMPGAPPIQAPIPPWNPPPAMQPVQQTWEQPAQPWNPPPQNWEQPGQVWSPPAQSWEQPNQGWNPPPVQQWEPVEQTWSPPPQEWVPAEEPPRAMPEIAPSWTPPPPSEEPPPSLPVEEALRPLPNIVVGRQAPAPATLPPVEEPARPLPQIGQNPARPATAAAPPRSGDEAPRTLPQIGPDAVRVPPATSIAPVDAAPRELPHIGPNPQPVSPAGTPADPGPVAAGSGRTIARSERWLLSSVNARRAMRARGEEDRAERDLAVFWEARGWMLSAGDQAYLDAVAALVASGGVVPAGRSLPAAPFPPLYQVGAGEVNLMGERLPRGTLFAFDYARGRVLRPREQETVPD